MDQEYIDSLAADLFAVLSSARDGGIRVDAGFQHKALDGSVAITYLFYTKKFLIRTPNMPEHFKRALKDFNILAGVDRDGKKVGIFLICATNTPFSLLLSEEDIAGTVNVKGFTDYDSVVREALKADLSQAMDTMSGEGKEQ